MQGIKLCCSFVFSGNLLNSPRVLYGRGWNPKEIMQVG